MTLLRPAVIIALLTLCAVYPFLPGDYDGLAASVALVAQILGAAGLLFVPIGALWLAHQVRKGARERSYALAAVILCLPVAVIVSLVGWVSGGFAFGCGVFAVSSFVAVWADYKVSVVGIAQFHYAPHRDGYNLYFEQPLPTFIAPGTGLAPRVVLRF